jgi:hypothetical protein
LKGTSELSKAKMPGLHAILFTVHLSTSGNVPVSMWTVCSSNQGHKDYRVLGYDNILISSCQARYHISQDDDLYCHFHKKKKLKTPKELFPLSIAK